MSFDFHFWVLIFFIYSFIGWLSEVIYCWYLDGEFINRGFLNGPLCPIYGSGAVLCVVFLTPFYEYPVLVFLLGMLLTSSLEYFTSYIMEKLFNTLWWDYSKRKFNINGRVCLRNSLLFGIMSIVLIYFIHPLVVHIGLKMPVRILALISSLLLVILTVDAVISTYGILGLNNRLRRIYDLNTELKERIAKLYPNFESLQGLRHIVNLKDGDGDFLNWLNSEIEKLKSAHVFSDIRLIKAFPSMKSLTFPAHLEELRQNLRIKINKRKNS